MIAASPDLLERVTAIISIRVSARFRGASSWAALSNGECSVETKQLLAGSTLLLVENRFLRTAGWSEMEGLRRLGVARLMMRHPYRDDGSILSISMNSGQCLARVFRFDSTDPSGNRPPDVQAGSGRKRIDVGRGAVKRSAA